jgi:hypothetical protein
MEKFSMKKKVNMKRKNVCQMYYNEEYGKYVVDLVIILIMKLNNVKLKKNVMIKNILIRLKKMFRKKQIVKKKNISVTKKENVYLNLIA